MELIWKDVKLLGDVCDKLMKDYNLRSRLIYSDSDLDNLSLVIDFEYSKYEIVRQVLGFDITVLLGVHLKSYHYEFSEDDDVCRLICGVKF